MMRGVWPIPQEGGTHRFRFRWNFLHVLALFSLAILPASAQTITLLVNGQSNLNNTFYLPNGSTAQVSLASSIPGPFIYFTTNGADVDVTAPLFTGSFTTANTIEVQAFATDASFDQSTPVLTGFINFVTADTVTDLTPGGGTVSLSPPGGVYASNSVVMLTANPASGWTFSHWSGGVSGTNPVLPVTLSNNLSFAAVFVTPVALAAVPANYGSIVANPPGGIYAYGTTIELSAVPGSASYFFRWANTALGTTSPTSLTVTNANPVGSALFASIPVANFSLSLIANGPGTIGASPSAVYYASNATVTITATPNSGYVFAGWTGGVTSSQNPLAVTMTNAQSITATFVVEHPQIIVQPSNAIAFAGNPFVLSVQAQGAPTLFYQWYLNQTNLLSGDTNATLSFANLSTNQAGNYTVIVTNTYGSVTSMPALVQVASSTASVVGVGGSATFSITPLETPPFSLQWFFDATNLLTGATNAALTVGNITPAQAGSYTLVISNVAGSITSAPVGLTVSVPLSVITVAGLPGVVGFSDGSGQNARFNGPQGVAVDGLGNVYIADQNNNAIRMMTPAGAVTTLAGSGTAGPANGVGPQAQFSGPEGVAVDTNGNVYVADTGNKMIRKIAPGQVVSTLANLAPYTPLGVAADGSGNVYVMIYYSSGGDYYVFKVSPDGGYSSLAGGQSGYADGPAALAQFSFGNQPCGIAVDSQGNLYVGDANNRLVRKLTNTGTNWQVSTAGSVPGGGSPMGVAVDGLGNVYAGSGNSGSAYTILEIYPNGAEATVAGLPGQASFSDGSGQNARFNGPEGLAVDGLGNVYLADYNNNAVRMMTPAGVVTTLAGSGTAGPANGVGPQAQFSGPEGVGVDTNGNVYVADTGNRAIRQIAPGQVVSTLASLSPYIPLGVAADGSGNVYVTVYYNNGNNNYYVFEVSPSGSYSSLAGGTQGYVDGPAPLAQFNFGNQPCGVAVDSQGNLYVGDANNRLVRKLTNTGTNWQVSTVGSVPGGGSPMGVAVDGQGNVYAGSGIGGYTILEIYPNGLETTVAGVYGAGFADGIGSAARFNYPGQMAADAAGNIYIADYNNATLRKGIKGPVIVAQPQSQTVGAGATVAFSVTATGSVPLTYQWQFNGANITGATNAVLSLGAADNADVGSYDVVVGLAQRNDVGNAITQSSALATLNVTYANGQPLSPRVVAGPQSGLVGYGGSYDLSVGVTGTGPFGFQWEFDGAAITGATNFDYTVGNALPAESGSYSVVISNAAGSITSAPVGLTVSVPLSVITVAGLPGQASFSDGSGQNARFSGPQGVAVDGVGNVYIADQNNNAIRLMTPAGAVTTLAGSGVPGPANGVGPQAQFSGPEGVAVDTNGNVYVADTGNKMIRKIAPGQVVSTLANLAPYTPLGVAADGSGNVYVTTYYAGLGYYYVFEVSPNGGYGSLAGGQSGYVDGPAPLAQFSFGNQPCGIAVDSQGNLYVGDANNRLVRKLTNTGTNWQVSTVGSVPGGGSPMGVAVDGLGNVYTGSGAGAYTILEIYPNGAEATVAGLAGNNGSADGIGGAARFYYPAQMAVDTAGNLYIADVNNATIRKAGFIPFVTTLPQSQTALQGANLSLSAPVSGTLPITRQWQTNGVNIPNATNSTLVVSNIPYTAAGTYDLILSNAYGATTSIVDTVTVLAPLVITTPPQDTVALVDGSAAFNVVAIGNGTLACQWFFDGGLVSGATNTTLLLTNLTAAQAGTYTIVITNNIASITSAPAVLTIAANGTAVTGSGLDGTWTVAHSPYVVGANVSIDNVSIQPGVNVLFTGPYSFTVTGVLQATGTSNNPVTFAGSSPTVNWQGLRFVSANTNSAMSWCVITGATNGGLRFTNTPFALSNCLVASNSGPSGGGIYTDSPLWLQNCQILSNSATYTQNGANYFVQGGGLFSLTGGVTLQSCLISNNAAIMPNIGAASETSTGGGLDCEAGTLTLNNCVVVSNTAAGAGTSATELGGGIYINNSTAALSATASTFTGNAARGGFGGGVSAGTAALTVCVLSGNAATFGGGLYLGGTGNTDATNCLMSSNTAAQGGAVYSSAATAVGDFENCTVVNNSPDAFNGFTGLLHDSILYSNGTEIVLGLAASPVVNYCDVQGGYFGPGSNNITVLPQFANSPNFTLADDSPLIDAGDPTPQFNDQSFPPSQGGDQNDLGAYGGPGAALWPQFAASLPVVLLNGQPAAPLQVMTLPISSALTISLTNGFPGGSFGYSLDGSDPAGYFNYSGPFLLTSSAVLRAVAYDAQFENYAISAPVYVNLSGSIPITATTAGGGTVSPASATVLNNTVVTFTATPSNGWQFLYWTNGISGLSNIISVNVTAPLTNVQAVFGTTLTVSHLPATSGTVQTNPSLAYYPYGTAVQLTALPTGSHYFTNWLVVGAATNFVSPLDLIVTNPTPAVVAVFGNEPAGFYTVNVSVAGGGDIARTPQQPLYPANSVVSLSATAAPGYIFSAWTGSATGAANPLNVTVTSNLFVTANFVSTNGPPPGPPLVAITNPVNATQFTLPASVTVNAGAQDTNNRGSISQLAFFAGSNQLAVLTNQPFIYVWTNPVVGTDLLTAVALNNFGLTATSTPVSITVSLPPPGQPVFSLSASQYQVLENAGAVTLTVTKSLNSQAGAVNFSTQDGSAVSTGSVINYQAASGSLAFNASDTSKTVSIPIVDNSIYEGNTSFGFFLSASGQGSTVVSPSSATVTIIDVNQPAPGNSFLLQVFPQPAPSATGQLAVYMTPSQAGGQWRFPWDLAWRTNGQVVSGLPPDNYPIQFQEEPGYLPYPPTLSVGVTNGGTTPITNQYLPAPAFSGSGTGSLTVNIGPNAPPGSGWQIYGITGSYAPGATAANLLPDNYFILFNAVGGWSAPAELAVPVAAGLSETVTVNYQLAATPPAQAVLPGAVPPSDIGDLRDFPFGYAGELQSDVGYGSGVVVRQNVVLTAAHLVFNDESLAYVSQAYWSFEQEGGKFGPDPLAARGWYVLSGYASQRMNDLGSGYAPDQSSPQSQNLDVAALYFLTPAGRGGYGGYLASDTVPNQWLTSLQLKMLVGYPVDGSVFGQTVQPGSMYYTSPISSLFTQQTNQVYVTGSLLSYPGNSGGPVYVQFTNGTYYPAAVYLGTIGTGQGSQTVVRAINNDVVNLITLAAAFGDSGTNNSGGGVITIIPNLNVSRNNPGYLILQLGPPSAVQAGAAWELAGQPANYYSTANPSLQEITSTNALALQFRSIPGWNLPTNRSVTVFPGVIVTNVAIYTVTNPALTVDLAHGLGISGTSNTSYQIQSNSTLTGTWIPFQTNILTNFGFFTITNHPRPGFYRALWLTNSP